ncbi:MAG: tRNA preQ1(34) S-adenosylmethionine ribosyltransferase-isomerase QueA [Verrucomicrobia bacterium]|nr:tRNA preQ1(34) S-adenosylmethionine ribosyltransferase-isomerase QueA [Verrucomicrobiota bacterium]
MLTSYFDYHLPAELIAQSPAPSRDQSRLMVVHRSRLAIEHRQFSDITEYLRAGDVLVLNDSRVIPARLWAVKPGTGGLVEILLLEPAERARWWALVRPAKRVRPGSQLTLIRRGSTTGGVLPCPGRSTEPCKADNSVVKEPAVTPAVTVVEKQAAGRCLIDFSHAGDMQSVLERYGEVPLPPYLERKGPPSDEDRERYQTVYARTPGSVAAPTAGLHFTRELLDRIEKAGVQVCSLTLHVGLATFAPVKAACVEDHTLHEEHFELPKATANAVNSAKREGRRVVAVGTTVTRVLESVAAGNYIPEGVLAGAESSGSGASQEAVGVLPGACRGRTRLFIYPPYRFRVVDVLLTNFHLPRSTLLMLVCAFGKPGDVAGREMILACYNCAVQERYRFYSYGDAMLIL